VRGCPEPQVTWYRNGQRVTAGERWRVEQGVRGIFSLVIKEVSEEDSGKYTCEASNDAGVRQVTVELTVEGNPAKKYSLPSSSRTLGGSFLVPPVENRSSIWGESPPKFVTKPGRIVVREGQTGRFSCKITGRPQPEVTWHKANIRLQGSDRLNMFEKSGVHIMEIQGVSKLDAGTYMCSVINSSGKTSVSVDLAVQGLEKTDGIATRPGCAQTTETSETKHTTTNGITKSQRVIGSDITAGTKAQPGVKPGTHSQEEKTGTSAMSPKQVQSTSKRDSTSASLKYATSTASREASGDSSQERPGCSVRETSYTSGTTQTSTKGAPPTTPHFPSIVDPKARAPFCPKGRPTVSAKDSHIALRYTSNLDSKLSVKETPAISSKETPSVASRYSCNVDSKGRESVSAKEIPTLFAKETSPVTSRYTRNIDSKVKTFASSKETPTISPNETTSLYTPTLGSKTRNISSKGTPHIDLKETTCHTPGGTLQVSAMKIPPVSATDGITSNEANSTQSKVVIPHSTTKETSHTSLREKEDISPGERSSRKTPYIISKETPSTKTHHVTPKENITKETSSKDSKCLSSKETSDSFSREHPLFTRKETTDLAPIETPSVFSKSRESSGFHLHQTPESRQDAAGDMKYQQKTSSTITLKSIKIKTPPDSECNRDMRRQEDKKAEVVALKQKVTPHCPIREPASEDWKMPGEDLGTIPIFDLNPTSQEVSEGCDVIFKCKVSGVPKPRIEWFKDGSPVAEKEGVQIKERGGFHCLHLLRAQTGESGSYSCEISNTRGRASSSWALNVKRSPAEVAPHFCRVLQGCSVMEGQDFVLECSVQGEPAPEITWLLNDQPIQYAHSKYDDGVAKLTVQDALPEDEGVYTCLAQNSCGKTSCSTTVTVTANPSAEIIWFHNGKEIQETEDFHFEQSGNEHSLYIQEVFPEDTGTYTCEAWNNLGQAKTEALLTVQEPQEGIQPWFISKPKPVTSAPGQNVLISCAIAGDPFPRVQWLKDGRELSGGCEVLQNEDVFTLILRNVQESDAGLYEIRLK
ncbi:hypothetical protein FKM82_023030, partial [Ascaphus truei]